MAEEVKCTAQVIHLNDLLVRSESMEAHMLQAEIVQQADAGSSFEAMAAGTKRKYIMISGKGGVGKTSLAASLAVKFAAAGHTTLVVSTDPAHSLSDSLDQVTPLPCTASIMLK